MTKSFSSLVLHCMFLSPFSMVDFDTGEAFTVELHSGDWLVLSSELAGVNGSKWYHSSPRPPASRGQTEGYQASSLLPPTREVSYSS